MSEFPETVANIRMQIEKQSLYKTSDEQMATGAVVAMEINKM